MKSFSLSLLLSLFVFGLSGQSTKPKSTLERVSGEPTRVQWNKMPCDPAISPITIISAEGELPGTGDNNPANGAFMSWRATGTNNLYYSRIYNGPDTFQIVQAGTSFSVYPPAPDGSYTGTLAIGGSSTNQCLQPGTWTVQVWDVMDVDGDRLPDRDANGAIIGCFTERTFDFEPSCPPNDNPRFDVDVTDIGCTNPTGSIQLSNFTASQLYCTSGTGAGATITWMGPGGFTASGASISGLAPGTYSVEVLDFYGCPSRWTGEIVATPPLMVTCPTTATPPTTVGGADGIAEIAITAGSGDYSISWTGPTTGMNSNAVNGINPIGNLRPGDYTFTITDDVSGCEEMCTVTVEEPPCTIDFSVTINGNGDIVITVLGGLPDFLLEYLGPTERLPFGPIGTGGITLPASDFVPGDYTFILSEASRPVSCEAVRFLTVPPVDCSDMTFTLNELRQPSCGGANDGLIDLSFTGNFNPTIVWTGPGIDGDDNPVQMNLGPGTYSFEIFDSRNCILMDSYTFTAPPTLTLNCGAVGETLATLDNGRIGFDIGGGMPAYRISYTATDPDGNPLPPLNNLLVAVQDTLRDLPAGTYNLTVTDANNCTAVCTAVVTEPNCTLAPSCVPEDPITAGGTGSVTLTFDGVPNWNVNITGPWDSTFVTTSPTLMISDLPQGDYTLNVFNSEGCVGSCAFSITGPTCALSFSGTTTDPSCVGAADGVINLDITGAAPGLLIDWNLDALDGMDTVRNLLAGDYTVVVSDQTGCPVAPQTFTINDPEPLIVTLSQPFEIACNGDSTGFLNAVVTGENGAVTYEWSVDSLPDSPSASGLLAGTYHMLATDENGCTARDTTVITEPELLSLSCSATGETAAGAMDGRITLGSMGGDAGAGGVVTLGGDLGTLVITADQDTTFTDLSPGTYNLTVTDANGCTDECTAIISQGGCEITVMAEPVQPDCDNAQGSATANVTNPNGMVTYQWSNDSTTATITNLSPGDYSVTVTDALGCEALDEVTIAPFTDFPTVTNFQLTAVCDNGCTELSFDLVGTAPFTISGFVTDNNSVSLPTTFNVPGPGPGSVLICPADFPGLSDLRGLSVALAFIEDGNSCQRPILDTLDIFVFPPALGTLDTTICTGTDFDYFGEIFNAGRTTDDVVIPTPSVNGCDSTVTVTVSFFPPALGTLDTTICTGTDFDYFGEIFNAGRTTDDVVIPTPSVNGCDSTVTVTVSFFPPALGTLDTTICAGTDFDYFGEIFNAGRTTDDVVIPAPSVNGCDSTVTVTVSFFPPALGTLDTTICTGTDFDYFGEIFNAGRTTDDVVIPTPSVNGCDSTVTVTVSFFPPALGTLDTTICVGTDFDYFGEIFNAGRTTGDVVIPTPSVNGCDSTVTVTVSFFPAALGTLDTTICVGTDFDYFGEIFNAGRTTDDVVIPTPSVNGCDSTVTVTVSFFPPALGTLDTTICAGTDFDYFGEIFNAGRTTDDVVIPTPSVNGCDSTVTVTVSFFPPALGTLDTTICAGTDFDYFGEIFNAGRTTDDVVIPTPSVNGCDSTVTVTVSFFPAALGTLDTTICVGTDFDYFGEIFNAGRTTDDVVIPAPSVNGCDSTVTVTVSFFPPALGTLDTTICAGTDFDYFGEIFNAGRTTDDVVIPAPSVNGCDSTVTVTVSFFPQAVGLLDTTICAGTVFRYAGRDYTTAVTDELITIPTPSGNGCDSLVALTVQVREVPEVTLSGEGIICSGGEVDLTLNYAGMSTANVILSTDPGEVISIPPGETIIQRLIAAGTTVSILSAVDGGTCLPITGGNVFVEETDLRVAIQVSSGDGIYAVSCAEGRDGTVVALAEGGMSPYAYNWNTGDAGPQLDGLGVGRYTVVVSSARGCEADALVVLSSPDLMVASVGEVPANCIDTLPSLVISDVAGGVGPYLYRTDAQDAFVPAAAFPDTLRASVGRTTLQIEDANGCLIEQDFDLAPPPVREVVISPERVILTQGDSVELMVLTDLAISGFRLTPGPDELIPGNSVFVGPLESTIYEIFVADSVGCTAEARVTVLIDDYIPVYAPTAFSPNGDGNNDVFRIFARPTVVSFRNFKVFNRWGDQVYTLEGPLDPQDVNWGWDGRNAAGEAYEPAVYVYSIDVELIDGRMITLKSDMVLMR